MNKKARCGSYTFGEKGRQSLESWEGEYQLTVPCELGEDEGSCPRSSKERRKQAVGYWGPQQREAGCAVRVLGAGDLTPGMTVCLSKGHRHCPELRQVL